MKKKTAKRVLYRTAWKVARERVFNPDYKKMKLYRQYLKAAKVYYA